LGLVSSFASRRRSFDVTTAYGPSPTRNTGPSVSSDFPCSHLDRAYRELCAQEGWKALSWVAIARALGKLTRRRLLKRNGVRFVAYRLSAPPNPRAAAPYCPGIAPSDGDPTR
jgi:hypothetical protein